MLSGLFNWRIQLHLLTCLSIDCIMTKRKSNIIIPAIIIVAILFCGYKFFGPTVNKPASGFLFVKTGSDIHSLQQQLLDEKMLGSITWFNLTEKILKIDRVKPGRYKIPAGMSIFNLVRMLRNGRQTPVDFVITKIRTKEQLAAKMGKDFEFDSLAAISFLNNNDSLRAYNFDSNTVMAAVLPLTYQSKWNTTPKAVFEKFYDAYKIFWTGERKKKATAKGLTVNQAVTMASIIDEETNATAEKPVIASVYLNRMAKGMPLQADPTVKFALKDFGIKRVLFKHLEVSSPYNTYKNRGLPPGPICTPMQETVEAVLNAPITNYLYFVASPAFDGTHVFSATYQEHQKLATAYQKALDERFGVLKTNSSE